MNIQSSLRDSLIILQPIPGTKAPGYYQSSLTGLSKQLPTKRGSRNAEMEATYLPFRVSRSSFIVPRSSFIVRRPAFIIQRFAFIVHRLSSPPQVFLKPLPNRLKYFSSRLSKLRAFR
ncbi:MAG TPA: hypothetical protein VEZ40_12890 [Pyrinomonadaceae bacterium]|nr:hypothetical protein [Pyrinomonadaceae bacterium]